METVELRHLTIGYIVKGQQRIVVSDINATINASELTDFPDPDSPTNARVLPR